MRGARPGPIARACDPVAVGIGLWIGNDVRGGPCWGRSISLLPPAPERRASPARPLGPTDWSARRLCACCKGIGLPPIPGKSPHRKCIGRFCSAGVWANADRSCLVPSSHGEIQCRCPQFQGTPGLSTWKARTVWEPSAQAHVSGWGTSTGRDEWARLVLDCRDLPWRYFRRLGRSPRREWLLHSARVQGTPRRLARIQSMEMKCTGQTP